MSALRFPFQQTCPVFDISIAEFKSIPSGSGQVIARDRIQVRQNPGQREGYTPGQDLDQGHSLTNLSF